MHRIFIPSHPQLTAEIQLSTENIPLSFYQCVFDFEGEGAPFISNATSQGNGVYTCFVPSLGEIPKPSDGRGELAGLCLRAMKHQY